MYRVTFVVNLFNGPEQRARSGRALEIMLKALTAINLDFLLHNPNTPKLYDSGVIYQNEPRGREDWQDIPTTLLLGNGDCEDLACWRSAELQAQGIFARPVYRWRKLEGGGVLYHILVRWPDGRIEDPSKRLGMGSHEG